MRGFTVNDYIDKLTPDRITLEMGVNYAVKLDCAFQHILTDSPYEVPFCMGEYRHSTLPLVMPTDLRTKRNLKSILKAPYMPMPHRRRYGLNGIVGIRTKEDTFYIGKNVIFDNECVPLFLPVVKYSMLGHFDGINIYIHTKAIEQNTFITRAICKQFIPVLASKHKVLDVHRITIDVRYVKPTIIISDMSQFFKTPKIISPLHTLDYNFSKLVEDNL